MKKETAFAIVLLLLSSSFSLRTSIAQTQARGQPTFTTGVRIKANGQDLRIDVETPSLSTFVIDWNNDGKKDLLLGTYFPAYVYLYLNIGTDASPAFGVGTRIQVDGADLQVYMGVEPFVVDWNGDGKKDLLVGNFGCIYLYTNVGEDSSPKFVSRSSIVSSTGYLIPCVVDWNDDGKKDLLVGHSGRCDEAYIDLYINIGTDASPVFTTPTRVQANGQDISRSYGSAPLVIDWDGDSKKDLIVREGTVMGIRGPVFTFYKNIGTDASPSFVEGTTIQVNGVDIAIYVGDGSRMFSITDWNNDGIKDLIAGDYDGYVWLYLGSTPPPIPAGDIYWLAKAIMSEASVGTREEQAAVGWTVLNRLDSGRFGDTIEDVVKGEYAYNQEPTEEIKALAKDLLERRVQDPTEGAMYFFSPRSMPKEGDDTTGFDVGGGLHQVPLDGQDIKVWFPSWAKPEEGTQITEYITWYLTVQKIPIKLEWRQLTDIRNWYFMFYRPYTREIKARVESPVELRVYDSEGRVTGLVNGTIVIEIPRSDYYDNTVTIYFPTESYRYIVTGTGEGLYGLTVTAVTIQENITFTAIDIPILTNATHQYTVDWGALSLGEEGVNLQIDSDGDGVFEQIVSADCELTRDEFLLQTVTIIDFNPDTLNLMSNGEWITTYIEFPDGYNVVNIEIATIILNNTIVANLTAPTQIGDYDGDSITDLMVKFDRATVIKWLGEIDYGHDIGKSYTIKLTITGTAAGVTFKGTDIMRILKK